MTLIEAFKAAIKTNKDINNYSRLLSGVIKTMTIRQNTDCLLRKFGATSEQINEIEKKSHETPLNFADFAELCVKHNLDIEKAVLDSFGMLYK